MQIIPWSQVRSWRCNACGSCCKHYEVVLKFPEWLSIVKNFGAGYTAPSISRFFLRKKADGSCVFLYKTPNTAFCSLQYAKPQACKLWPFKVSDKPKYGNPNNAVYQYNGQKFYVYADSACDGLTLGVPTQDFAYSVVPEFIEIALGLRRRQFKTTALF